MKFHNKLRMEGTVQILSKIWKFEIKNMRKKALIILFIPHKICLDFTSQKSGREYRVETKIQRLNVFGKFL